MSSLQAFCVRCQALTEASNAKTVMLQNDSRALKGTCKSCQGEVFRFLPKKTAAKAPTKNTKENHGDAYCLKCHSKTVTLEQKMVVLKSNRKALRGVCQKCHSEVYKFVSAAAAKSGEANGRSVSLHVMSRHPAPLILQQKKSFAQFAVLILTVVGFTAAAGIFLKASSRHWQPTVRELLR